MSVRRSLLLLLVAAMVVGGGRSVSQAEAGLIKRKRVLLVFAPDAADPRLAEQRRILAGAGAGMAERDLALVPVLGDAAGSEAADLRWRYGAGGIGFQVVLVGKDGCAKLRDSVPIGAERLFSTVDAMPMRRQEMR